MTTKEDLIAFLAWRGIPKPPDFFLDMILAQVEQINECMEKNNYPQADQNMLRLYLAAMLINAGTDKQVSSHSAPSGASQSFRLKGVAEHYRALLGLLRPLDPAGCAVGLIPPSPEKMVFGGLYVSAGGCSHE